MLTTMTTMVHYGNDVGTPVLLSTYMGRSLVSQILYNHTKTHCGIAVCTWLMTSNRDSRALDASVTDRSLLYTCLSHYR